MSTTSLPHKPRVTRRVMAAQPSASMALEAKIGEMRAAGVPVISFGAGEPDFPTPDAIKLNGHEAIDTNLTKYTPAGGTIALRKAIGARMKADTGFDYATSQIVVTNGGKEAIYLAMQALIEAGDEVIIPAPYWVSYPEMVRLADGVPVVIPTTAADNFRVTPEMLRAHSTPRTRMFVLVSPSNPTGMVYSRRELEAIADWMRGNDALLLTDELYDRIVFEGEYARWLNVAPDLKDRTIVINGLSKSVAMTGWRIGFAAAREEYIKAMGKVQGHSTSHPSSISQHAALKAYTANLDAEIAKMVVAFRSRRDWIVDALNEMPGVSCLKPEGAFYVFPELTGLYGKKLKYGGPFNSSAELAMYALETVKVGIIHGEAFGAPGYARMSYALALDKIQEGVARLADAFSPA
ncbi:MAG: pyridoxal phosphate-dependent aminotransferase [Thermoflexales bacterium]|nr:pyridoxal phosphate-dependent aminotransferase [Thermoflexales bacterium]